MRFNILLFGAGAIGCFVGGSLAGAGHRVTLLGRDPLMSEIAAHGLTLRHPNQPDQTVYPATTTDLATLQTPFDFVLLTVKMPDVPDAIATMRRTTLDWAGTHFVALQNGIGSEEQLATAFGPERVLAATLTIPIAVPETGVVAVSKAKGGLGVAAFQPAQQQHATKLAAALNEAGLSTLTYNDYQAMKWSKLLLNIINNATSAILDEPPAEIIAQPALFNLEIEALQEAMQVMQVQGLKPVKLAGYPSHWLGRLLRLRGLPYWLLRQILRPALQSGRGSKMPSMQLDLAAGRTQTEVHALNGAVVQAGRGLGVATPVNQVLTETLGGIVAGQLEWESYRHQPARLLQAVEAARR